MLQQIKVVYIAGEGRSGSTIFGNILGQVEGCFHTGELRYLWKNGLIQKSPCACGTPVVECDTWKAIVNRAFSGLSIADAERIEDNRWQVDRVRYFPLLETRWGRTRLRRRGHEFVSTLRPLYESIARQTGPVIIDSSKYPSYGALVRGLEMAEFYVIHLVRDARGVVYSWSKRKLRDPESGIYLPRRGTITSVLRWIVMNVFAERLGRRSAGRYLRVRYEDFVAAPAATVDRILSFLQHPAPPLKFEDGRWIRIRKSHAVSGNPSRFHSGPVELRSDSAWLSKMRPLSRWLVTLATFPLLWRYGYIGGRGRS